MGENQQGTLERQIQQENILKLGYYLKPKNGVSETNESEMDISREPIYRQLKEMGYQLKFWIEGYD